MDAHSASHPADSTLQAYGLGRLDEATARPLDAHLKDCPACRRRVAELSSDSFLGRLRDAQGRPASTIPAASAANGRSARADEPRAPAKAAATGLPAGLAEHPDYEIVRELGRGETGGMFLAINKLMGRHEVLKVVDGRLVRRPEVLERFSEEIRNAARLHHPNLVTAYSALKIGEALALAVEYVEGLDLARLVQSRGILPIPHACNYISQAALGLQHAHEHGLIHGDIKPGNLMLARQGDRGIIKILDFGLARFRREHVPAGTLTPVDNGLDTPAFMAPEQAGDPRRADIRADIYSLGCTLYFLLTGKPPFQGANLYEVLQAHQSMEAVPLNLARPDVPMPLAIIVATMMAKEPERRFQAPRDVAQALAPFFKKPNPESRASSPQPARAEAASAFQLSQGTGLTVNPRPANVTPSAPPPMKPAEPPSSGSDWDTLVAIKPEHDLSKEVEALRAQRGSRGWLWPAAAVGGVGLVAVAVVAGMKIEAARNQGGAVPTAAPTASRSPATPPAADRQTADAPSSRSEPPSPPRTVSEPTRDRTPPPRETVIAQNEDSDRAAGIDAVRRPEAGPSGKGQPVEPTPDPKPVVAEKKAEVVAEKKAEVVAEKKAEVVAEPPPEDGSPDAILAKRGLRKAGRFYTIATESEVAAAWQGVVPFYTLMEKAQAEFVEAMQIAAYAQELNDNQINLQAYIRQLNSALSRANRDERVLLQNQIQVANANLTEVQAEIARVRTRLVSPARRQQLQDIFMKRREEFLGKSGELRPILDRMNAGYASLKQDNEVTSALKALKERQKGNVSLGPSDKLKSLLLQLRQAEEAVSLNPDAYRRKKKSTRLEPKDAPKDRAGPTSR